MAEIRDAALLLPTDLQAGPPEAPEARPGRHPGGRRTPLLEGRFRHVIVMLAAGLLWHLLATLIGDESRLPSPLSVGSELAPMVTSGQLTDNALASLRRMMIGYLAAAALAVPLGTAMALSRVVRAVVEPPLEALRPVPPLALLPILLVLVGVGDVLATVIVMKAAFFPILLNSYLGASEVDRVYLEAAKTLGVPRSQIVRRVIIPAAMPQIFTGFRLGAQFAWMSIVAAELIGAHSGLGYLIVWYKQFLLMDRVVVVMIVIGIIGFVFDRLVVRASRRLVSWQAS